MKVLLEDGFSIQKGTGIGQHTLHLFQLLKTLPEIEDVQLVKKPFLARIPFPALRRAFYISWLNTGMQLLLCREQPHIVHFTNYLVPVLRLSDAKYVVTIHDLTAWRFPEVLPPTYLRYIKWAIFHAVKTADLILTVSNAVKEEIIRLFKVDNAKICTGYSGLAKSFCEVPKRTPDELIAIKDKFGINKDFLLFVGTLEKRKNVVTLIKTFKKIKKYKDLQLVLVGKPGYGFSDIKKHLDTNHLGGDIVLTGYASEEEKIALYDLATAFVYPSLYEGFGTPLVEAMARGVPIIASRIPSTEEIAGEAALYYDNPMDHEGLASRIMELLESDALQQNLVEKGLKRAQEFSWEKVAKIHLMAYQDLVGADKR